MQSTYGIPKGGEIAGDALLIASVEVVGGKVHQDQHFRPHSVLGEGLSLGPPILPLIWRQLHKHRVTQQTFNLL